MNGEPPNKDLPPGESPAEGNNTVPRNGSGAETALIAMLRKRQMRAGAEPKAPQPDGEKARGK